jgi:hypothetical protein
MVFSKSQNAHKVGTLCTLAKLKISLICTAINRLYINQDSRFSLDDAMGRNFNFVLFGAMKKKTLESRRL